MNREFFNQEEFFVERKLNNKGELELVSQRRSVDFGQFPGAINLDEFPKFDESKEVFESDDGEIIGKTKNGKLVFRNTDNSDMYKRPEKIEMEMKMCDVEILPEFKKTKKSKPKKLYTAKAPFYY